MDTIHVYPVTTLDTLPHVLTADCWCKPTVEHVAAAEPQPPPAPVEPPADDEVGDEPDIEGDET